MAVRFTKYGGQSVSPSTTTKKGSTGSSFTGSYNISTQTYTSSTGEKYSVAPSNIPAGTTITWSSGGGGGSSGGGGGQSVGGGAYTGTSYDTTTGQPIVPITSSTEQTAYTVEQIKASAQQQQIQAQLEKAKQDKERMDKLLFYQNSSYGDFFNPAEMKKREIQKLEEQRKSVEAMSRAEIDKAVKTGKVSSGTGLSAIAFTGQEEIRKVYERDAKIQEERLLEEAKAEYEQSKAVILQIYQDEFNRIQNKVNEGYDINKARKEWETTTENLEKLNKETLTIINKNIQEKYSNWNKKWLENKGVAGEEQLKSELAWKRLEYKKKEELSLKALGKDVGIGAVEGAVVTGGIFGGLKLLESAGKIGTKLVGVIKAGASAGGSLLAGAVSIVPLSLYSHYSIGKLTKEYENMGFSGKEAKELATVETGIGFVKSSARIGGFFVGAVSVGKIIDSVSNMGRISEREKAFVDSALAKNPDAIKMNPVYRKITQQELNAYQKVNPDMQIEVKISGGGSTIKPINQVQVGEIVGYNEPVIDTTGLSKPEIKAIKKVVSKIDAKTQVYTYAIDKQISQLTYGELKTPFIQQQKFSLIKGTMDSGKIKGRGFRQTYEKEPTLFERVASRVIKNYPTAKPKISQLKERSFFDVEATGKVKSTKGLFKYRGEEVVGKETRLKKDIYKEGLWVESDISKPVTATKGKYLSKRGLLKMEAVEDANLIQTRKTSQYEGLFGKESSRNILEITSGTKAKLPKPPKKAESLFDEPILNEPKQVGDKNIFGDKVGIETKTPLGYGIPRSTGGTGVVGLSERGDLFLSSRAKMDIFEIPESPMFDMREIVSGTAGKMVRRGESLITIKPLDVERKQGFIYDSNLDIKPFEISAVKSTIITKPFSLSAVTPSTKSKTSLMEIQSVKVQEMPIQQFKSIQLTPFQPFKPMTPTRITPPVIPTGFFGSIQVGGGQRRMPQRTALFKQPAYNPSLASVLLRGKKIKITKEEYKKLGKKKYSGLESRPLFEIVK